MPKKPTKTKTRRSDEPEPSECVVRYDANGQFELLDVDFPLTKRALRERFILLRSLLDKDIRIDAHESIATYSIDVRDGKAWSPYATILKGNSV